MLKLYGTSKSRSARSLWALEELGLKYEHVPVEVAKAKSPEHLKLNPNGHIPVLEDDGKIFWESMAINLYLAAKYGKAPFWPESHEDRGHAVQWSFWGMTEAEPHLIAILRNRMLLPPEQRNEQAAVAAVAAMQGPLKVLDGRAQGSRPSARQGLHDRRPQPVVDHEFRDVCEAGYDGDAGGAGVAAGNVWDARRSRRLAACRRVAIAAVPAGAVRGRR